MTGTYVRLSQEKLHELPDLRSFASEAFSGTNVLLEGISISSPVKRAQECFRKVAEEDCSDNLAMLKRARHELGYALRYYINGDGNEMLKIQEPEKKAFDILCQALNKVPELAVN